MTESTQPIKRQHPPTPIGRVLNKYAISLAQLSECLREEGVDYSSRSTLHRMVNGKCGDDMKAKLHPAAARCLGRFLVARGLNKSEIDAELTQCFTTGEYQPMITGRLALEPDECRWFDFLDPTTGKPVDVFSRRPESVEEVFISPTLQKIVDRVIDAIRYQDFVLVSGDIGTGKSTVRNTVAAMLDSQADIRLIRPDFPMMERISPMQVADAVLDACGADTIPQAAVRRSRKMKQQLANLRTSGERIAIDIDEGHHLHPKTLSSLKNFVEMTSGGFLRYLGAVIYAQPSLQKSLTSVEFREINERITVIQMPGPQDEESVRLGVPPFLPDAPAYLAHRLKYVNRDLYDLFDQEALDFICPQASTPLQLGNIANQALRISKNAYDNKTVIGAAIRSHMFFEAPREQAFRKRA